MGESRREQVRLQEELAMKEKALRDTQIRSMHEMREMKRAQELRVVKFSVQKLRENHDTIQRLTSQMRELQERVNGSSDSGEFQEVESNFCGKNSHVPCQPAVVPSPRSMLSRDKRLPLDTWNLSGPQENVFGNPRRTFDSSQTPLKEFFTLQLQALQVRFQCMEVQGHLSQEMKNDLGAQYQMPMFAGRPSTMNSYLPADIPQNSVLDSKDSRYWNFNLIKFPHFQRFHVGR